MCLLSVTGAPFLNVIMSTLGKFYDFVFRLECHKFVPWDQIYSKSAYVQVMVSFPDLCQAITCTNGDPVYRDHFVYAPSQWETTLHCNVVSHWLGAYTKWSLCIIATRLQPIDRVHINFETASVGFSPRVAYQHDWEKPLSKSINQWWPNLLPHGCNTRLRTMRPRSEVNKEYIIFFLPSGFQKYWAPFSLECSCRPGPVFTYFHLKH